MSEHTEISLKTAAGRALLGRCPCCGQGKLMRSYLKQVENCAVCGESFGQIRADDAAPWLTIILVGHVFLPLAFMVNVDWMPTWAAMLMWSTCFCRHRAGDPAARQGAVHRHPVADARARLQAGRAGLIRCQFARLFEIARARACPCPWRCRIRVG